jgi:predicted alpha/beta-hydrolase family hydrolase
MSTSAVPTPHGEGRSHTHRARRPVATLLVSHGAGRGTDTPDLEALAEHRPRHGITVVRFDQPWVVAGRKVAGPPATLDDGLRAAAARLRRTHPLVLGGRSAGARSAARCADELDAAGCLALAFPLHPPGRPEKSRLEELQRPSCPTLVIQGERDPFGRPEEFPPETEMCVVPGADHSLKVPARGDLSREEALGVVVEAALEWIIREVAR